MHSSEFLSLWKIPEISWEGWLGFPFSEVPVHRPWLFWFCVCMGRQNFVMAEACGKHCKPRGRKEIGRRERLEPRDNFQRHTPSELLSLIRPCFQKVPPLSKVVPVAWEYEFIKQDLSMLEMLPIQTITTCIHGDHQWYLFGDSSQHFPHLNFL